MDRGAKMGNSSVPDPLRDMPLYLPLAICLLMASIVAAADPVADGDAAAREEAKALHTEALRASDLWTVLQVEAWAATHDLRLRPGLPGVTVVGDPLLAAPDEIDHIADLGERLVVSAGHHAYQWRLDGRPLARSRRLPIDPDHATVGFAGTHLALARSRTIDTDRSIILLITTPLAEGEVGVRQEILGQNHEQLSGLHCADDGSAAVVQSNGFTALKVAVTRRLVVAHRKRQWVLPGWHDPLAVGRDGAWLAAHRPDGAPTLLTSTGEIPFHSLAAGPGIAVLLRDGGCELVKHDGTLTPLDPPIGLGKDARVVTCGEWLVFASGAGATTRPSLDLLGNPVGGGAPQPPTCAWLRWKDLLDDPATPAFGREAMSLCVARSQSAALLRCQDRQLDLIDLAGTNPVVRPFATASAPVKVAEWIDQCAVLDLGDGAWQVLDAAGREVWSGKAGVFDLLNRRYAVAIDGTGEQQVRSLVRLDADPAQRTRVPLMLETGDWTVRVDRDGSPAVAWRTDGVWRSFAVATGAITARGDDTMPRPEVAATWRESIGRFVSRHGRPIAKAHSAAVLPPTATWAPIDAWRLGKTSAVIGHDGRVYVTGKRGDYVDLGVCPGAAHFVRRGGQLLVADSMDKILAGFSPGPALDLHPPGQGEVGKALPRGPWQVAGLDYVPPRSTNLTWNPDTGITPRRLRSPDIDGMLVILTHVLLEVDATAARQLGRKVAR